MTPLRTVAYGLGVAIEWVDGRLDNLPGWVRDDGKWTYMRHAQWGCYPLRMHRLWDRLLGYGEGEP